MIRTLQLPLVCFLLAGCFSTKSPVSNITRIPVKFDYSPPSRGSAGSVKMTIALVRPVYIAEHPEYFVAPFPEMSTSMGNDFEELLTAKGFTIRGPFRSRDEMVYNDKQNSNFTLQIEIDLQPNYNRKYKYEPGLGAIIRPYYKMNGEITLGGNLVIVAASPVYGEKLWKKNIALDKATFTYSGSLKWDAIPSVAEELKQDNELYNILARELEKFYGSAMKLAWQQIETDEMKTVADQAKNADAKR